MEIASHGQYLPPDLNRRRLMRRAKMKSLRFSVVIVMAFIICWTPYYTMMIIFMFLNPDEHVSIQYLYLYILSELILTQGVYTDVAANLFFLCNYYSSQNVITLQLELITRTGG